MELIKNLKWRYATKQFDPNRKVSGEDLEKIKEAVQLSVSSYGLQAYKVFIVEDPAVREKLKAASWNQSQITDASHLFVFCHYAPVQDAQVDEYIELVARERQIELAEISGYGDFIKRKIAEPSQPEKIGWAKSQTYIALTNLLIACAELRIDACPMEGFEPEKYNEILGLTDRGLQAAVIAPIGYRAAEDTSWKDKKVRKPVEVLFEHA